MIQRTAIEYRAESRILVLSAERLTNRADSEAQYLAASAAARMANLLERGFSMEQAQALAMGEDDPELRAPGHGVCGVAASQTSVWNTLQVRSVVTAARSSPSKFADGHSSTRGDHDGRNGWTRTRQVSPGPRRQAISSMFPYGFQIAAFHAPPESSAMPSSAQWSSRSPPRI